VSSLWITCLAATYEVADRRGLPARVLAVEMILAATQAITGSEVTIGREAVVKGVRTVFSDIADADLREAPERVTAAFLARSLFAQAAEVKLDMMAVAKEVVAVSYAELVDNDDKVLSAANRWHHVSGILCQGSAVVRIRRPYDCAKHDLVVLTHDAFSLCSLERRVEPRRRRDAHEVSPLPDRASGRKILDTTIRCAHARYASKKCLLP